MNLESVLQYGALGLLALVLAGGYRLARVLVERIASAFDAQAKQIERVALILDRVEAQADRRHRVVIQSLRRMNGHDESVGDDYE